MPQVRPKAPYESIERQRLKKTFFPFGKSLFINLGVFHCHLNLLLFGSYGQIFTHAGARLAGSLGLLLLNQARIPPVPANTCPTSGGSICLMIFPSTQSDTPAHAPNRAGPSRYRQRR